MKRMSKMKKIRKATVFFTVMALALTGCGNTAGSEKNNVAQEISDIEDQESNTGQTLSDMLKVNEEKWNEDFEVSGGKIHTVNIRATVKVPDVTSMSILTLEEQKFDAAGKKALVEKICAEGEIYSFDDTKMPKWFYESQVEDMRERIEFMLSLKQDDESWGSEDEQHLKEMQQDLDEYQQAYEEAPENGYDVGDYAANSYTGITDKGRVIIYFNPDENSVRWEADSLLNFSQKSDFTSSDELGFYKDETDHGNLCTMSEEEAKNYAVSFATKLGYEEYVASDIKYLTWQNYSTGDLDSWTDGYVVTLAREVNGVPVDYTNVSGKGHWVYGVGEYIQLQFNDAGVIRGQIYKPRKLKTVDTENTQLLSYEKIKDVIRVVLPEKAEDYSEDINVNDNTILWFSDMELIYYSMKDEEQGIVVVPAWRLSTVKSENETGRKIANQPFVINAIDGSWIDIWEDLEDCQLQGWG